MANSNGDFGLASLLNNPSARRKSVLVVDDCIHTLSLTCEFLEDRGYSVRSAQSAEQAMDMLQESHTTVLVSDMCLPNKSGAWLISEVLRQNLADHTIVITGGGKVQGLDAIEAARTAGAHDIFPKPFSGVHLLAAIGSA